MTPQPEPTISVVVCTYTTRRLEQLRRCVDSVREQLRDDELIIVVDNEPSLARRCRELWPDLLVCENSLGRGLSSARTTGLKHGRGSIVAFLDDDAEARPGWLAALRARFADPEVVGVSGRTVAAWTSERPAWFPEEFGWVVGCDYRGMPGDGEAVRNPIGANMAFRTSALEAVGGFHGDLGRVEANLRGGEETEIGIRVLALGRGRIVRELAAVVDHQVPADRATLRYFTSRCWHEGRSKATLSHLVGSRDALASERRHLLRTLPRGLVSSSFRQVLAILVGTAATALGYLTARRPDDEPVDPGQDFVPIALADFHLDAPDLPLPVNARGELAVLAFDRGWPVGQLLLDDLHPKDPPPQRVLDALGPSAQAPRTWPGAWTPPPESLPSVSVVIPTLGRRRELRDTVTGVLAQTHADLELLVVDNAPSASATTQILAGIDDPRLRIVESARRGASVARNVGLAHAGGEIIAFTDDDATPDPRWLEHLLSAYALAKPYGESRLAAVTGLVVPDGFSTATQLQFEKATGYGRGFQARFWSARTSAAPLPGLAVRGHEGAAFPYTGSEFGSGNNMSFRADVLRRLGGFDEALGPGTASLGAEDLELMRRLYLEGETIAYVPHAVVRHVHRHDEDALIEQMHGYGVGMGASLAKLTLSSPVHAFGLLRKLPRSLMVLLAPRSVKNATRDDDYPPTAVRAELRGYLSGPWRYLQARRSLRPR